MEVSVPDSFHNQLMFCYVCLEVMCNLRKGVNMLGEL